MDMAFAPYVIAALAIRLVGAPLFVAFGLAGSAYLLAQGAEVFISATTSNLMGVITDHTLISVLCLAIMTHLTLQSGSVRRVLRFAVACFGATRGGVVTTAALASMLLGGVAGARNQASDLLKHSYIKALDRRVSIPTQNAAEAAGEIGASLGALAPPSFLLLIMAFALGVPIVPFFLAAIVPGLISAFLILAGIWLASRGPDRLSEPRGFREFLSSLKSVLPVFGIVLVVLVPVIGAEFTITEATATAAFYALILACFGYRQIGPLAGVPHRSPSEILAAERVGNLLNPLLWFARLRTVHEILGVASSMTEVDASMDYVADAVIEGLDEPEVQATLGSFHMTDLLAVSRVRIRNLTTAAIYLMPALLDRNVRQAFIDGGRQAGYVLVTVAILKVFVFAATFAGLPLQLAELAIYTEPDLSSTLIICAAVCTLSVFLFDAMLVLVIVAAFVAPFAQAEADLMRLGIVGMQAGALGLILRQALITVFDKSNAGAGAIVLASTVGLAISVALVVAFPQLSLLLPQWILFDFAQ